MSDNTKSVLRTIAVCAMISIFCLMCGWESAEKEKTARVRIESKNKTEIMEKLTEIENLIKRN